MRVIVHDDETVVNVVDVAEGWKGSQDEWHPGEGLIAVPHGTAQIGWMIANGAPVEPQSPAQDLDDLKAFARQTVITRSNLLTEPILSKYPEAERAGWDKREAEARAIIAAQDKAQAIAATSIIKALAVAAGETTAATVARAEAIVAKADEFAAISAAVEVMRDQALAAIDAVENAADVPALMQDLEAQAAAKAAELGLS